MSRRLPSRGAGAVLVVGLLLAGIVAAVVASTWVAGRFATDDSAGISGNRFYDVPSPLMSAAAGTVLRTRPAEVWLDGAPSFTATPLLYHSRTVDDRDQIVSGTLFTPTAPAAGGTLLTLAPGIQGSGRSARPAGSSSPAPSTRGAWSPQRCSRAGRWRSPTTRDTSTASLRRT
jgi:hypothetical protein